QGAWGMETGVINDVGRTVIPFDMHREVVDYAEGFFIIYDFYKNEKGYGYMNEKGEIVIKPIFEKAKNFIDGIAEVIIGNFTLYINKKGNCVQDCPSEKWLKHYGLNKA